MTAIHNIENIMHNQGVIPLWLPMVEYPLNITYDGFNTTLMVSKNENDVLEIKLHSNDIYDPCLRIEIQKNNIAYIDQVATDSTCIIPSSKKGTWIMKMSNAFLCSIGVKNVGLQDDARLECGKYHPKIILLRIFEGRYSSWYQNFGYISDTFTDDTARAMRELHNYPARSLFIEKVQSNHKNYTIDAELIRVLFEKYPAGQTKLGDYMVDIWKKNCSDYSILEEFIRWTDGSWSPLIKIIEDSGTYINRNVCGELKSVNIKNMVSLWLLL